MNALEMVVRWSWMRFLSLRGMVGIDSGGGRRWVHLRERASLLFTLNDHIECYQEEIHVDSFIPLWNISLTA